MCVCVSVRVMGGVGGDTTVLTCKENSMYLLEMPPPQLFLSVLSPDLADSAALPRRTRRKVSAPLGILDNTFFIC